MAETLLTGGEWNIMRELWEEAPLSVMELVARLSARVGWAKSTTITTLRRMEAKGLVAVTEGERGKRYAPLVAQEEAALSETRSFLSRVYRGSVGLMVSTLAQREELSEEEIAQLREILRQVEEKNHG
ncbi:MAG: BlaI/MecI/CopY family transcriptional regulator [bacterium]